MEFKGLPKKARYLWQMRCFGVGLIIVALCAYFYPYYKFLFIAGTIISFIAFATICWYIPLFIKSYKIVIEQESVVIKRGVIIKTTRIMPYSRLIYTQTFTTPIAKLMGLTCVSLKAARSTILIPEMPLSDAKLLIETITQGGGI